MNLLAHALLAAPDHERMIGSLVGDFVRGPIDPALPANVRAGIALHRAVDSYTDSHAEVRTARALFEPPLRRYAGILVDIWFDHLLASRWDAHGDGTLDDFSRHVRELIRTRPAFVPERMRGFVAYLHVHDLPAAYRDASMIGDVLRGVSGRLTRANPLADALPVLLALDAPLRGHFEAFFPDLRAFAARHARVTMVDPRDA